MYSLISYYYPLLFAHNAQIYNDFMKMFPDAYLDDVIFDKKDEDK